MYENWTSQKVLPNLFHAIFFKAFTIARSKEASDIAFTAGKQVHPRLNPLNQ